MEDAALDTTLVICHLHLRMTQGVVFSMRGRARINQQGRIVIPAECRATAGLKPGDELIVETVGEGEIRLRTKKQALREAQRIVARHSAGRDLVAELIAERREEAERE
jgi:AbrB family looped-hinge helix DNA binding protein